MATNNHANSNFNNNESGSGSLERNPALIVDENHPLFLHPTDVSGTPLIFIQLTGTENYSPWCRSIRIGWLERNKLGFIDRTLKKESFREELWPQWERVNVVVLSWLMNTVSTNLLSGVFYASNA